MIRTIVRRLSSAVGLTASRYPSLRRGDFSRLTDKDANFFEAVVGKSGVFSSEADCAGYNTDWLGIYRGQSALVLRPVSTEQISAILRYCVSRKLAVCPQGGNTGLVGGSVPLFDEVILSLTRLNRVISFDETSGVLLAEAGCILESLDSFVAQYGYTMPLDLGAKGSCHIGGNVATSAGGMRLIRYGSLHAHLLGIEAVLPDASGTVLSSLSGLRKDNTGFHLPHLFLGSEGVLGVITKVSMTCPPKPTTNLVAFLGCATFDDCVSVLAAAKRQLGEILSSFELMDRETIECVMENMPGTHSVLADSEKEVDRFSLLVEVSGSNSTHDEEKLHAFLESCMQNGSVTNGIVASESSQIRKAWAPRELATEALRRDGFVYKQDISLPLSHYYRLVEEVRARVAPIKATRRVVAYGHVGDGNVHLNITSKEFSRELYDRLYPFIFEWTAKHNGSVSAEHGLGFAKRDCIGYSKSAEAVELMRRVKTLFDPTGILNPYKVLPDLR